MMGYQPKHQTPKAANGNPLIVGHMGKPLPQEYQDMTRPITEYRRSGGRLWEWGLVVMFVVAAAGLLCGVVWAVSQWLQ